MIESFEIKHFRRFKQINFEKLNRINIFLGNNNTGKTSILESIFGFACGENIAPLLSISMMRKKEINSLYDFIERILASQFNQNVKPFTFSFSAKLQDGSSKTFEHQLDPYQIFADFKPSLMGSFGNPNLKITNIPNTPIPITPICKWKVFTNGKVKSNVDITFPPMSLPNNQPYCQGRFVDILSHREQQENTKIYSFLKRENVMDTFVQELSNTFEQIEGIDTIPYPDSSTSPVSFKLKDRGLLPMYNFGDGLQRWYNILGGLIVYQNAIHCIEEVDATFHPNAQKELALNLLKYSKKYNNQIFMTSHSIEFIDNLLQSIYESRDVNEDVIRIITLKNDPNTNEVKARVLTGLEAYESREKYQLELR